MHKYKLIFKNGKTIIEKADNSLIIIRKYDLCTKENIGYKLIQLD